MLGLLAMAGGVVLFVADLFVGQRDDARVEVQPKRAALPRAVPAVPATPPVPQPPPATPLSCGNGELTPELTREVFFTIPSGNCWTIWVMKPDGAANFWSEPDGDVWVTKVYADGTTSPEILDNPLKRTVDPKTIVKRRYRNPGMNPVSVRILLQ